MADAALNPSSYGLSDIASGSVPVPGVASLPAFNREHGGELDA